MEKRPVRSNRWVHAGPSPIHGTGLFARVAIPEGTFVVEYEGPRLNANDGKRLAGGGNEFMFRAKRREFIDGSVLWNLARYANHACNPNAQSIGREGGVWLRAIRPIAAGEEITYDYGFTFRDEPTRCTCGGKRCAGTIVAKRHRRST